VELGSEAKLVVFAPLGSERAIAQWRWLHYRFGSSLTIATMTAITANRTGSQFMKPSKDTAIPSLLPRTRFVHDPSVLMLNQAAPSP